MSELSIFRYKISGSQVFILILLVLVLIGLSERILYDLSRTIAGTSYNYFEDLTTILIHTIFVSIIIALAAIINVTVSEKKEKYAIVMIPYFITSIVLGIQVAIEAAVYFAGHHTQLQFYLVMTMLCVIPSVLIYMIQKNYVPREVEYSPTSSRHSIVFWVFIFLFGGPIVLWAIAALFLRSYGWW